MQLLCSTGAFTRSSDPLSQEAILRYAPQFNIDGFEVIFYPRWYQEQERIADTLQSSGLRFLVLHTEKSIGGSLAAAMPASENRGLCVLSAIAPLRNR